MAVSAIILFNNLKPEIYETHYPVIIHMPVSDGIFPDHSTSRDGWLKKPRN